jgi:hypothetical protein
MPMPGHSQHPQTAPSFAFEIPVPRRHHVERFKSLYEERYGISLSDAKAADKLAALLIIVRYRQYEAELNRLLRSQSNPYQPDTHPNPSRPCRPSNTSNMPEGAAKNAPTNN